MMASSMLGRDRDVEPLPHPDGRGVHAALEEVLLQALSEGPCFVSFSGGRDSSAILALASDVARRHALPLPVPVTMRFPRAPDTEETVWQQVVLEHLRLPKAEVVELDLELDALGSAATDTLREHGILWPGNAYMHRPVFELARGGTLLTGIGGDEVFGTRVPRRSARQLAVAALPRRAREALWLRRTPFAEYGWLTPIGRMRVYRSLAREDIAYPHRWDRGLRFWYLTRAFGALVGTLGLVARGCSVEVVNPLLDRQVLAELSATGNARGFASRSAALSWLCGDLLPERAITRSGKATFHGAVWGPAVRAFAAEWAGEGLDPRNVDIQRLKEELQRPRPDFRTVLLLQKAWLHTAQREG